MGHACRAAVVVAVALISGSPTADATIYRQYFTGTVSTGSSAPAVDGYYVYDTESAIESSGSYLFSGGNNFLFARRLDTGVTSSGTSFSISLANNRAGPNIGGCDYYSPWDLFFFRGGLATGDEIFFPIIDCSAEILSGELLSDSFVPIAVGGPVSQLGGQSGAGPFADFYLRTLTPSLIPEPGTLALLGVGLMGLGLSRSRNAKRDYR